MNCIEPDLHFCKMSELARCLSESAVGNIQAFLKRKHGTFPGISAERKKSMERMQSALYVLAMAGNKERCLIAIKLRDGIHYADVSTGSIYSEHGYCLTSDVRSIGTVRKATKKQAKDWVGTLDYAYGVPDA